jgi:hypothetical protein
MREETVLVCSDGAGASDLIEDGENGFTVPAEDGNALAEAIDMVHSLSAEQRRRIGRRGYETVQQTLAPRRVARHRGELYKDIEMENLSEDSESWLAEAVRPSGKFEVDASQLALLDRIPLRRIGRYVLRRIWRKVFLN